MVTLLAFAGGTAAVAAPVNVAKEAGIAERTRTFNVSPVDFNRDRKDDFFFVRHNPDNLGANLPLSTLYRGTGRRFAAYASSMFGKSDKHVCVWGDANVDGRRDMFCAVGLTQKSKNELWIQRADGSFVNRAQEVGLHQGSRGRYRYGTFIHANNDLRPDIYVARYTGSCNCDLNGDGVVDYDGDSHPNELWINEKVNGKMRFTKSPGYGLNKPIGAQKDTAACTQAVDYDRDRDQDLLVCSGEGLRLYRNKNGRGFNEVTGAVGIAGSAADARFVDLNRDGRRDLVRLTRKRLTVRHAKRRGGLRRERVIGNNITSGTGLAFGRFNRGPTTDIYVMATGGKGRRDHPDRIYLQRKNGTFRELVIPATSGRGDDVAALDYNGDGRADFLVSNGDRKKAGPLQLFTWRR